MKTKIPRECWSKKTCMQRGHPDFEIFNSIDKESFVIICPTCHTYLGKVTPLNRDGIEKKIKNEDTGTEKEMDKLYGVITK